MQQEQRGWEIRQRARERGGSDYIGIEKSGEYGGRRISCFDGMQMFVLVDEEDGEVTEPGMNCEIYSEDDS